MPTSSAASQPLIESGESKHVVGWGLDTAYAMPQPTGAIGNISDQSCTQSQGSRPVAPRVAAFKHGESFRIHVSRIVANAKKKKKALLASGKVLLLHLFVCCLPVNKTICTYHSEIPILGPYQH